MLRLKHAFRPLEGKFNSLKYIYLGFVLLLSIGTFAATDSIKSIYKDGKFSTHYELSSKGSADLALTLADYLVNDFHYAPGHLFEWALKDLGLQNKDNELIIVFKSSKHDVQTGVTHGVFDIVVPGVTTFSNIKVDAIVTRTKFTSGVIKVSAKIIYSSLLLKNALCTVLFIPQKNDEIHFVTDMDLEFGWFFNLFITQKRYKNIVEWRIKKFSENMVNECELRQNKSTIRSSATKRTEP